ncbi:MAG: glutaminyl-peptide cyclotransferase [Deltaproteobacteria bacterium]|jgi:glutamine cyclotransferase|nr:glutaminyl-peptide cyclotransferase [Deltaproteobacteria bacterium]
MIKGPLKALSAALISLLVIFYQISALSQNSSSLPPSFKNPQPSAVASFAPTIEVKIEQIIQRPPGLFTQGLLFFKGALYESTGGYSNSALWRWEFEPKNQILNRLKLKLELTQIGPKPIFAEGLSQAGGFLYLLTWREGLAFKIEPNTLAVLERFNYQGEGWGLAYDGSVLWRSDGSNLLQSYSPRDFKPIGPPLAVFDGPMAVKNLNELEYDQKEGLMLANVWHSQKVAAISLIDGRVLFWLDLSSLAHLESLNLNEPEAVLNGLAFDERHRLWITGKLWPRLYRVSYKLNETLKGALNDHLKRP